MSRYIFLFILSVFPSILYPQSDSVSIANMQKFVTNIQTFNRLYPQEKVWLHFDNTGYYLDETVWFKAYCVTAPEHLPDTLSNVLYVELLNPLGKVLETKKLKIVNGQCYGDFKLTPFDFEYCAGFYEVRAYTKWMLNFGEETIFSRVFPVFNPPDVEGDYASADMKNGYETEERIYLDNLRPKNKKQKKLNFDFFPEGGSLVKNLTSTVAFKATDENGKEVELTGKIINPHGDVLSKFSTFHNGMGKFVYTPNNTRNRVITEYNGTNYTFNLPEYKESGYVLTVSDNSVDYLSLKISKSARLLPVLLGISIQCRGDMLYFRMFKTEQGSILLNIPKNVLRVGVNQITLFDGKGEIFAERMVFASILENEKVTLNIKHDKENYNSRERITLNIQANEKINFSLAVRDAGNMIHTTENGNILTGFLLSSDIKGFIENPDFYFDHRQSGSIYALDLLLLVHGWRRYEWQTMTGIKPAKLPFNAEKGLEIRGHIEGKADKIKFYLSNGNKYIDDSASVNSSGIFNIYLDDFEGVWTLSMNADGLKNANRNIRLDRWFSPAPKTFSFKETLLYRTDSNLAKDNDNDSSGIKKIEIINDTVQYVYDLSEIKVAAIKGKSLTYNVERDYERWIDLGEKYVHKLLVFQYLADKNNSFRLEYMPERDPLEPPEHSSIDYMILSTRKKLPLLFGKYAVEFAYKDSKGFHWNIYGYTNRLSLERNISEVQKIVMAVDQKQGMESMLSTDMLETSMTTDMLSAGEFFEDYATNKTANEWFPVIVHHYQTPSPKYFENIRYTFFEGFSAISDFYQNKPQRENYMPSRSEHYRTLYWNPNIETDINGNAKISFYNTAFCREININAEGITADGVPFSNNKVNN